MTVSIAVGTTISGGIDFLTLIKHGNRNTHESARAGGFSISCVATALPQVGISRISAIYGKFSEVLVKYSCLPLSISAPVMPLYLALRPGRFRCVPLPPLGRCGRIELEAVRRSTLRPATAPRSAGSPSSDAGGTAAQLTDDAQQYVNLSASRPVRAISKSKRDRRCLRLPPRHPRQAGANAARKNPSRPLLTPDASPRETMVRAVRRSSTAPQGRSRRSADNQSPT
jgi:hypothetical protein